jgi:hypothetical protein
MEAVWEWAGLHGEVGWEGKLGAEAKKFQPWMGK